MDKFSKEKRSEIMSRIRSSRTKPEILFHNLLKGNRVRHLMWPELPGSPDVLLLDLNVAVFVNGCFWHGCRRHFRMPKTNKRFWEEKIKRNAKRQRESAKGLKEMGFGVLVIWEHELTNKKAIKL